MILEGIVATQNANGLTNIAPMGPVVDENMQAFELKPFQTSTTFRNLAETRGGVLHVTDDVLLYAQAVTHQPLDHIKTIPATHVAGCRLPDACRAYEFTVEWIDRSDHRAIVKCNTVAVIRQRDFFGFNRAKHAIIEAAVLVSRIDFIPIDEIHSQLNRLATIVQKTGGPAEQAAWELLQAYACRPTEGHSTSP